MNSDRLQNLRDIHLLTPISWWPLAPGWYVVMLIVLLLLIFLGYKITKYLRKGLRRKNALKSLLQLRSQYPQQPQTTLIEISMLVKRCALSVYPRQQVAFLTGLAWLEFLDETGQTTEFSMGVGTMLMNAPYQRQPQDNFDINNLIVLIEK